MGTSVHNRNIYKYACKTAEFLRCKSAEGPVWD